MQAKACKVFGIANLVYSVCVCCIYLFYNIQNPCTHIYSRCSQDKQILNNSEISEINDEEERVRRIDEEKGRKQTNNMYTMHLYRKQGTYISVHVCVCVVEVPNI